LYVLEVVEEMQTWVNRPLEQVHGQASEDRPAVSSAVLVGS
jgi:hypothetical protein